MGIVQQTFWRVSITLDAMRRDGLPGAWSSQEGPGGTSIYTTVLHSEAARPPRFKSEYIPNICTLDDALAVVQIAAVASRCRTAVNRAGLCRLRVIRVDAFVPS